MTGQQYGYYELRRAVARIQAGILAVSFAVIGGASLFLLTAWLVIKGGEIVGPHLELLSNYFIGYSVTWPGAFIGMLWGALSGAVVGWLIGLLYNRILALKKQ